jgi:glycosyltransferase involved in cell wall biosynthesis
MIDRAIRSVLSQDFENWELIIVQDGENRDTNARLLSWQEREPRIRYFPRGRVGSIAEASNYGLDRARGDYIAILDDDDFWSINDKLTRQVEFLDAHADYVACGGGYIMVDVNGRERGRFIKPIDNSDIKSRAIIANPIANSTSMFRRVINEKPVQYNVGLQQFADWDFWLTLGSKGKLYNFEEYLAYYSLWEGGSSFKHQKANALAAISLVWQHRHSYPGFSVAITLAWLYWLYAHLPNAIKRLSYDMLSRQKKAVTRARFSK